jgi:methanogenic corrinoid protein MtbC1
VPTEKVVEFVREEKPGYLGLSALLTTTMTEMGVVIEALKENKLKNSIKVLIGGAAVSEEFAREIGADAYCVDGFQAVKALDGFETTKK